MIYLSQLLGNPVYDAKGENIGRVNDLGIATGEVFPRVTSLAIEGPSRTPFMLSWRKYVDTYNENEVRLKVVKTDIRFSYLQPDEVLIARDLLNKQIVDTRGVRVVRVNDLKLSDTNSSQLRLLGAEVGARGLLRSLSPKLEHAVMKIAKAMGKTIPEKIIAWNYMDLLDRDLSDVKLSVTHKTLDDMHPADIADIIERLDPRLRGQVFAQLDAEQKAGTIAEFDDDTIAADIMSSMNDTDASQMLSEMDPDDAAELVGELDYDKAEKLLRLMGVKEQRAVRQLLGYKEDTAGRIMTSEVVDLFENDTVADAIEVLSNLDEDFETIHYIYIKDKDDKLTGAVSLNALLLAKSEDHLKDIADIEDLKTANPDDDQEDVAEDIAKYNLLAMPVVDDQGHLLGNVTVDDALDVLNEEHAEDLQIAGAGHNDTAAEGRTGDLAWLMRNEAWFFVWMLGVAILAALFQNRFPWQDIAIIAFCMPVAVIAGNDAAAFVTKNFLEYDPDDEDAPSMLGMVFKGVGLGVIIAVFVALIASSIIVNIMDAPMMYTMKGVGAAAASALVCFATTPIALKVLRTRDERNLETSGTTLAIIYMAVAIVLYLVLILVWAGI
ncbi:MAG: magnesium transporter [Atopobiaceae bacterium]